MQLSSVNVSSLRCFQLLLLLLSSFLISQVTNAVTPFACGSTLSAGPNYFAYTGTNCLATVPASVTSLCVHMWGAGGGIGAGGAGGGGAGAYVEGGITPITIPGGSIITVIVGQGASTCQTVSYFGGGGSCGTGSHSCYS